MAGGRMHINGSCSGGGGDGSSRCVLIQSQKGAASSSQPLDSPFLSAASSSSPFLGSGSMMSFKDVHLANGSYRSFFRPDENGDEDFEGYFHQPEKKRRLTVDQVQFLEKSFEVGNKLEPERKLQLAKDLGLQPRQVAIWFQNRRARWKTKQLEKDYDILQRSNNNLKADYEDLLKEKDKLKAEVLILTDKLNVKEEESGKMELCYLSNTLSQEQQPVQKSIADSSCEGEVSKVSIVGCKQEDMSSTRSDIFDSDSSHYTTDGVHSSLMETGDSSYVFEADQSDLSQDEDNNLLTPSSSQSLKKLTTQTRPQVPVILDSPLKIKPCGPGLTDQLPLVYNYLPCITINKGTYKINQWHPYPIMRNIRLYLEISGGFPWCVIF